MLDLQAPQQPGEFLRAVGRAVVRHDAGDPHPHRLVVAQRRKYELDCAAGGFIRQDQG